MDHAETQIAAHPSRSRRLLLKLIGAGGIAGAGAAVALSNQGAQAAPAPTANALASYIAAKQVDPVVAFLTRAFGGVQTQRFTDSGGVAYHATVRINGADLYVGREDASLNFKAPATIGAFSSFVILVVPNANSAYSQALAAGATMLQAPLDMPFGRRLACVADPFGQYWQISEVLPASPSPSPSPTVSVTPTVSASPSSGPTSSATPYPSNTSASQS